MNHKTILLSLFLFWIAGQLYAQTGIAVPSMSSTDQVFQNLVNQYKISGASFAIARQGKLVYARSFGYSDQAGQVNAQPYNLYRIASVSKPVTSIGIMKLIENGQLTLTQKVFGPTGILNQSYYSTITDNRVLNITVQNLLEHSGGWNRNVSGDPMFNAINIANAMGVASPPADTTILKYMLGRNLDFTPGSASQYSNFGYLILGRVIEKVTGMPYEEYMQKQILEPLGIFDMVLGKNLLANAYEREGYYADYTNAPLASSVYNNGQSVPWPYGGFNVEAMDAHGGWIATARDLVRLLSAVDGFTTRPDILSTTTRQTMVTPSAVDPNYAKGWSVNTFNHWWHNGSLPGTSSIWVRTSSGYLWAAILNTRDAVGNINGALDNAMWNSISNVSNWPTHNWFNCPTIPAKNLMAIGTADSTVTLNFEAGNGTQRMVVVHEGSKIRSFPLDGQLYSANARFGSGDDLGSEHFVVYNGSGNQVVISGLNPGDSYFFRVFEYKVEASQPLYLIANTASETSLELTTSIQNGNLMVDFRAWPSPARDILQIAFTLDHPQPIELTLQNQLGQIVKHQSITGQDLNQEIALPVADVASGIYLLKATGLQGSAVRKVVIQP